MPPNKLRHALPLICIASIDFTFGSMLSPNAGIAASMNAALPDALDARPASAGKEFCDTISALQSEWERRLNVFSMFRICAVFSFAAALVMSCSSPFMYSISLSNLLETSTLVFVDSTAESRVMLKLELFGRFCTDLRPQYLMNAILGDASAVYASSSAILSIPELCYEPLKVFGERTLFD